MTLTAERQALVDAIRGFCTKECGDPAVRRELTNGGEQPHHEGLYRAVAELGWLGAGISADYGGSGGDLVDECLVLQQLARGAAPVSGIMPSLIVAGAYQAFGSEKQKQQVLPAISAGAVQAIAMSEPEAGSDVAALTCRATRDDGGFLVNGQKTWITNAHFADNILTIVRTQGSESRHHGLSMLEIPTHLPGVDIRPIATMGGAEVNDVYFTDCHVPTDAVVGQEGAAWPQLMAGLNRERLLMASQLLGVAQRAHARLVDFVSERHQFGRTLDQFQAIRHRIADLATEIECCEAFVYTVAERVRTEPSSRDTSMVKLKATELAKQVTLEGMQLMGGYGYASEYEMEQDVRIALGATIYGGTSEIQREIIAKSYLKRP